jgi:hypothetical protein
MPLRGSTLKDARGKLWQQLMEAWDDIACHLYPARRYTQKYAEDMYGWIALADVLYQIARYDEARDALLRSARLFGLGISVS